MYRTRDARMSAPEGFSLVELLIVIAIVSVLAAILLPTLQNALTQARQLSCLNDRRQFALIFNLWGSDHADRVPTTLGGTQVNYGIWRNMALGWGSVGEDLGVMARYGYVQEPRLYFCPGFARSGNRPEWFWDTPSSAIWKDIVNQEAGFPGGVCSGVSNYFMVKGNWQPAEIWTKGYTKPNLTFGYLAENWQKSAEVSPILQTCANWAAYSAPCEAYTDSTGYTKPVQSFYGITPGGEFISHDLEGVNAIFVDGSGRWLSKYEVTWSYASTSFLLSTYYRLAGNMHLWGRRSATIGRP